MKYVLITVVEREITSPIVCNSLDEAQAEMNKMVFEILGEKDIEDYGEIGENYAWLNDVYGCNYDFAIYEI